MRIVIEIPEDFEVRFKRDRFEDSLRRLNADAHSIAGDYEKETSMMLIKALKNSVVFQDSEEKRGRLIDADELIAMIEGDEELISWQKHYFIELVGFCDTISDDSNSPIIDKLRNALCEKKENGIPKYCRSAFCQGCCEDCLKSIENIIERVKNGE